MAVSRIKSKKTISCFTPRHHFAKFANFEEVLAELVSVLSLTSAPLCISYYKQSKLYRLVGDDSRQLECHQCQGAATQVGKISSSMP